MPRITLCQGSFIFDDMEELNELSAVRVENARFVPASPLPDKRGKKLRITDDGLLGNCLGGVFDAAGRPIPEARQRRDGTNTLVMEETPVAPALRPRRGQYVYGGVIFGYYGHFLLESLSRLWFIAEHAGDFDGIVFHLMPGVGERALGWLYNALSLLGIDKEKVALPSAECAFEALTVPEPAFESPATLHPAMAAPYERMARAHLGDARPAPGGAAYISRTGLDRRGTLGELELEAILREEGIDIIHMENSTFEEKIELFNRYERIIALSGSGLHNVLFSLEKPTLYVINRFSRIHVTYPAIDRVKGLTAYYACVGKCNPRYEFVPPYVIDVREAVGFLAEHGLLPFSALELADQVDQLWLYSEWSDQALKRRGRRLKIRLERLMTRIRSGAPIPLRLRP